MVKILAVPGLCYALELKSPRFLGSMPTSVLFGYSVGCLFSHMLELLHVDINNL